jgi:hypothetical protein
MNKPIITTSTVRLVIDVPVKIVRYTDRVHIQFDGNTPYEIEPEITNQIQHSISSSIGANITNRGSWFALPFCQDFDVNINA